MPATDGLLFRASMPPMRVKKIRYYEEPEYVRRASIRPPEVLPRRGTGSSAIVIVDPDEQTIAALVDEELGAEQGAAGVASGFFEEGGDASS